MNSRAGEPGYGDDDRLPWLETVEEDYHDGPSLGRILLLIFLLLAVVGAGVFGYYWYERQKGMTGNGELINAQEGDYKVKPDEIGGQNFTAAGDIAAATSQGADTNASINADAMPEAPVEGRKVAEPAPGTVAQGSKSVSVALPANGGKLQAQAPVSRPTPAKSAPAAGSGALIQLGAFPDEGGANAAWKRLSTRFAYLAPLGKSVEKAEKNGKTVYRLRVNAGSNGQARDLCGKLKVAGENCYIAN